MNYDNLFMFESHSHRRSLKQIFRTDSKTNEWALPYPMASFFNALF